MSDPQLLLQQDSEQKPLQPVDIHFSRLMGRLDPAGGKPIMALAALVSQFSGEGHSCVPIALLADKMGLPESEVQTLLSASSIVGVPGDQCPLITEYDRVYLYRYWDYECRLQHQIVQRLSMGDVSASMPELQRQLEILFPHEENRSNDIDWQRVTAVVVALNRLSFISGGPGTGKTTTVVRILALLLAIEANQDARIELVAPTGKAAARLQESVLSAKDRLPATHRSGLQIPDYALTIHRLLGSRGPGRGFRYHQQNPLPLDILVVDEVSMVDLGLMVKLLEAVTPNTRVIMLGDRDQLASVEAGAVLADICAPHRGYGGAVGQLIAEASGYALPLLDSGYRKLDQSIALLKTNYRFASHSQLGQLAIAVNAGDVNSAWTWVAGAEHGEIVHAPQRQAVVDYAVNRYQAYFQLLERGEPVDHVFSEFNKFRLLTALRNGEFGAKQLNRIIELRLAALFGFAAEAAWYPGKAVMIRKNDPRHHLSNGDIGIAVLHPQQGLRVCFQESSGYRYLSPSRLPEHEPAYAMTIHKSQGSEFDEVALVLPDSPDLPVLTRELLYTGITRAKSKMVIYSSEGSFKQAVGQLTKRHSGLPMRLQNL